MVNRKSSGRRHTKTRKRSRVARLPSCKGDVDTLLLFNKIDWDVSRDIDDSVLDGMVASEYPEWLETEWCTGPMTLLLPVSKRDAAGQSLLVYYSEKIKRKSVRFGDVLYVIWNFYNTNHVAHEDLTYVSVSDTMKDFAETHLTNYYTNPHGLRDMRLLHFITPQTQFKGLQRQHDNIYSLNLSISV